MPYIKLSKKAFNNNVNYYSNLLKSKDKICIALKDNAYGHGIQELASLSKAAGVSHVMVRDNYEAKLIENYSFKSVLILYDFPQNDNDKEYIYAINCFDKIKSFPKNTKVELKIDTGMSRNGIPIDKVLDAINEIKKYNLILNGTFTHFHSADNDDDSTVNQEKKYLDIVNKIKNIYTKAFRIHCSNTHGIHKVNNDLYDIARIGIGLYGYSKYAKNHLKAILSLHAFKISTRILSKNDTIGYGASFKVIENNTKVSNYDIGYGNGFFRVNENQSVFIANGQKILGKVSMDSFSTFGDDNEVCVFENASNLAKVHNTIEYEILTHLMPSIKRVIVD